MITATVNDNTKGIIIEKEGKAELVCHFCNKVYQFNKEELEDILKNIEKE